MSKYYSNFHLYYLRNDFQIDMKRNETLLLNKIIIIIILNICIIFLFFLQIGPQIGR
jgi:hypothetical protein